MAKNLQILKELGGCKILRDAAEVISSRGLAKGIIHNKSNGSFSCTGAIYVACGASATTMPVFPTSPHDAGVPLRNVAIADETILYLESFINADDIEEWGDRSTAQECVSSMVAAANRLMIIGD